MDWMKKPSVKKSAVFDLYAADVCYTLMNDE